MKLSLSTDFGTPAHWDRLVDFASRHGVQRLVFWGDFGCGLSRFLGPYLYPKHPQLVPDNLRGAIQQLRDWMAYAGRLTHDAGMEFWYVFQALEVPDPDHTRQILPDLFNADNEPDMSGELVYRIIRDQIDELKGITQYITGIETWIMECAPLCLSRLRHQQMPSDVILGQVVDTIYQQVSRHTMRMSMELHTAGGDIVALSAFKRTAQRYPDIIIGADDVIGDFSLHLPFNAHLIEAAKTNPIQVNFDLNGEYWGRNFIPTCALQHYEERIETARALNPVYINGRVCTGHDTWSPYANILPSRRCYYPAIAKINTHTEIPGDVKITCTDTLGGMNAEFFCRRVHDAHVQPKQVAEEFLMREFGPKAKPLTAVFIRLQAVLAGIFFTDKNYEFVQSIPLNERVMSMFAVGEQMTCPEGAPFPPVSRDDDPSWYERKVAFAGWPVPAGHHCAGPEAIIQEKYRALAEAHELLDTVVSVCDQLDKADAAFLTTQFEDLVSYAQASQLLTEAQVHYYNLQHDTQYGNIPDLPRLQALTDEIDTRAAAWLERYPVDRYNLASSLRSWIEVFRKLNVL